MRNSFARALLQVLALLTGLAVAAVWRDRHNSLTSYPELISTKARLALGVNGAQSFVVTPVSLASGALNLGAWFGHQEILVDRTWNSVPEVRLRARADGASELNMEFRPAGGVTTILRLSNRPERPSAWLTADGDGKFLSRRSLSYLLPRGKWIQISLTPGKNGLTPDVDGEKLGSHPAPALPLQVLFRGDSTSANIRIDAISLRAGEDHYEQQFSGEMPWVLFLLATVAASLVFFVVELFSSPRAAATISGAGFLVLCGLLALFHSEMNDRYPRTVDLSGLPSHIEAREAALARLRTIPASDKPLLLWLGGSQAWGAGASAPEKTAFERLRARNSGMDWVNGAISGAKLADQKEVFNLVRARRKISRVVLISGVNDAENSSFPDELRQFAQSAKAAGAALLLVPEPTEPGPVDKVSERRGELMHFARKEGIPFVDLEPLFEKHADDGFLWWDFVHLTDAGAALEAEGLQGLGTPSAAEGAP